MSITTILFDVGGVLIEPLDHDAVWRRRDRLDRRLAFGDGREMWHYFYGGPEWEAAKTGGMTRERFWEALLARHGLTSPVQRGRFVDELFAGEEIRPEMVQVILTLHGHYRLGILSNADDGLEELLQHRLNIARYFEAIVNSCRIGVAKPDRRAFEVALERLEVTADAVLFVDDQERNTLAAADLGMSTHLYNGIPGLLEALRHHSISPEQ